jgi:hypothetical protein
MIAILLRLATLLIITLAYVYIVKFIMDTLYLGG